MKYEMALKIAKDNDAEIVAGIIEEYSECIAHNEKEIKDLNKIKENLEWAVYWMLEHEIISMSRGRELLRFETMNEMREWDSRYISKMNKKKKEVLKKKEIISNKLDTGLF